MSTQGGGPVGQVPRQYLPDGIADLPPGAELAAQLAGVDLSRLNGHDLIALAPAYVKLISHFQAQLADVMQQINHCAAGNADSPVERVAQPNPWAHVDLAASLRWSASKAEQERRFAHQLARLPMLHEALASGALDISRVRTIIKGLWFIDDEPARLLADSLLRAGATGWTSRQIGERLRRAVLAVDPQGAERRRRHTQAYRRVSSRAHADGTVSIYASNLPPDRVAEMIERVEAIARTAKQQGDQRTVDQLRADIVCDLVAGTGIGATAPGPVTNPGPTGLRYPMSDADLFDEPPADQDRLPVPLPGPRRGVVNVYAWLSTIVGSSQAPGELGGIGPVTATMIRKIIADNPDLQWRLSLYDDLTGCDGSCGCDGTCHTGELAWHGSPHTGHGRAAPPTTGADQAGGTSDADRSGFSATDIAFIRARDRTCRGPQACPTPAAASDTDHTIAKTDGGPHTVDNGGPLCERDHMYKHRSGSTLQQIQPGVFVWITQFGHTYTRRPETPDDATGPPPRDPTERLQHLLHQAQAP